jgi:hypothetical protein
MSRFTTLVGSQVQKLTFERPNMLLTKEVFDCLHKQALVATMYEV